MSFNLHEGEHISSIKMRMTRVPVGLPVMEVGNYHLKNDDGSGLVKDSQRSLDRRLPVEQGGRKPPGE